MTARTATRLATVEGYRALAAFGVLLFHVSWRTRLIQDDDLFGPYMADLGRFGVGVFFMLSGFLLWSPYLISLDAGEPAPSTGTYAVRRFLRIFPAYWVALTVLLLLQGGAGSLSGNLTLYSLTQVYRTGFELTGLTVAWTLCIEIAFYATLPLLAWVLRQCTRRSSRPWQHLHLLLLGAMAATAVVYRTYVEVAEPDWPGSPLEWLPAFLDWFALGMLLAAAALGHLPAALLRPLRWLADRPVVALLFTLEIYWLVGRLGPTGWEWGNATLVQVQLRFFLLAAASFLVLTPGLLRPDGGGGFRRLLRSRPLVAAGAISYGIFLWHLVWLTEIYEWRDRSPGGFLIVLAGVLALTLPSAWLTYRLVERPAIDAGRRFGDRRVDQAQRVDTPSRAAP